jgi:hypothetical protein
MTAPFSSSRLDQREAALAAFVGWFRANYPGPDTIICKPDWHAPKVFRAVEHALEAAGLFGVMQSESAAPVTPSHGGERSGCPCTVEGIEPCSYACSCAHPFMSGGCQRCAAYGSLEQRQAAARRLISSATTRGPWPLDTLIGRALDDLYRAYGIDFPRTNSDLRRCFSVAEKYLAATESRNTR